MILSQCDLSTSPTHALRTIQSLHHSLTNLKTPPTTPLLLAATLSKSTSRPDIPFTSTLGRELWFVVHHAIHHAALIRVMCVEFDIPVSTDFGVAPATKKHLSIKKEVECARL